MALVARGGVQMVWTQRRMRCRWFVPSAHLPPTVDFAAVHQRLVEQRQVGRANLAAACRHAKSSHGRRVPAVHRARLAVRWRRKRHNISKVKVRLDILRHTHPEVAEPHRIQDLGSKVVSEVHL